jgi:hypothetical protein
LFLLWQIKRLILYNSFLLYELCSYWLIIRSKYFSHKINFLCATTGRFLKLNLIFFLIAFLYFVNFTYVIDLIIINLLGEKILIKWKNFFLTDSICQLNIVKWRILFLHSFDICLLTNKLFLKNQVLIWFITAIIFLSRRLFILKLVFQTVLIH